MARGAIHRSLCNMVVTASYFKGGMLIDTLSVPAINCDSTYVQCLLRSVIVRTFAQWAVKYDDTACTMLCAHGSSKAHEIMRALAVLSIDTTIVLNQGLLTLYRWHLVNVSLSSVLGNCKCLKAPTTTPCGSVQLILRHQGPQGVTRWCRTCATCAKYQKSKFDLT